MVDLQKLVRELVDDAELSETEIAAKLTELGTPVSQPTVNRIKHGAATSFDVGSALVLLHRQHVKSAKRVSAR